MDPDLSSGETVSDVARRLIPDLIESLRACNVEVEVTVLVERERIVVSVIPLKASGVN